MPMPSQRFITLEPAQLTMCVILLVKMKPGSSAACTVPINSPSLIRVANVGGFSPAARQWVREAHTHTSRSHASCPSSQSSSTETYAAALATRRGASGTAPSQRWPKRCPRGSPGWPTPRASYETPSESPSACAAVLYPHLPRWTVRFYRGKVVAAAAIFAGLLGTCTPVCPSTFEEDGRNRPNSSRFRPAHL